MASDPNETDHPSFPQCDKLRANAIHRRIVSEFLDWLDEQGWEIADSDLLPIGKSGEQIIAAFLDIDLEELERERRALLEWQRQLNNPKKGESSETTE